MEKKYRHKVRNKVATLRPCGNYYNVENEHHPVAAWIIENSNDWEPIVDKEYDILEYKSDKGIWAYSKSYTNHPDHPTYLLGEDVATRNTGPYMDRHPKEYSITKVRRVSDGSIWQIGDKIVHSNCRPEEAFVIDKFYYEPVIGAMWASPKGKQEQYCSLMYAKKVEPVQVPTDRQALLEEIAISVMYSRSMEKMTNMAVAEQILSIVEKRGDIPVEKKIVMVTEDQKCIYDIQQLVYGVDIENWETTEWKMYNAQDNGGGLSIYKWFSEPENRQEWIEYHKPCLSQKEVIEEVVCNAEIARGIPLPKDTVEIIKCALDTYVMHKLSETK